MKKMNKKGFTLIELLAVIIILGVLLLIAVPSVSKYIQQSREKTYKTNLSKLVDEVSAAVNAMDFDSDYTFDTNEYLVVPIVCVELERGSNTKSPFNTYDKTRSFIVVERKSDNSGFKYYVTAKDLSGFGTKLAYTDRVKIESVADNEVGVITVSGDTTTVAFNSAINSPSVDGKEVKLVTCDAFK